MENIKTFFRLALTIAGYCLVGFVFLFFSYATNNNNEGGSMGNFLFMVFAALIAFRFATKLTDFLWWNVDSVLSQTYSGGKVTFAQRVGFNGALILYFVVLIIGHVVKDDFTSLTVLLDILFLLYASAGTLGIYQKYVARCNGAPIPEPEEEE